MSKWPLIYKLALLSSFLATSATAHAAYNSGSTGADGEFNPTTSQSIQLPEDGIFNYISVNIPAGVTITYIKNAANTPVTILASGDVTIAGTIDVSAKTVDTTSGGKGGPGGFDGGNGGSAAPKATWLNGYTGPTVGRAGVGPGGGAPLAPRFPGTVYNTTYFELGHGGGGAYGLAPPAGGGCPATPGVVYGNATLTPLIGGSGGGGGAGGVLTHGTGGGGGGGALLIAASGTINVTGAILANGGTPATTSAVGGSGRGSDGGGGSGGAIRLIATTLSGNGAISAAGGAIAAHTNMSEGDNYYLCHYNQSPSSVGGVGRIRFDADSVIRTSATIPPWTRGTPTLAFIPGLPALTITNIGGVTVPAGNSSIALSYGYTNPVTVNFATQGVTVGSTIKLTVTPARGAAFSATSEPTTGNSNNATASVAVTLEPGSNVLLASVTYTIVASLGDAMSVYAQGERVEKVTLATTLGSKESTVTLITVSGKEYVVPASALAAAQG